MCRYYTVKKRNNIVDLKESQEDRGWIGVSRKKKCKMQEKNLVLIVKIHTKNIQLCQANMANFGKYSFCSSANKCIMKMCKSRTYKIKWLKTVLQETLRKRANRGKRKKSRKAEADDTWGD